MSYSRSPSDVLSNYARLNTIPALLSVFFAIASLYQFGGISTVDLTWLNYTLTAQHSMLVSLGAFMVAFASSETKQFDSYQDWEQVLIAAGPVVILTEQYVPAVADLIAQNSPLAGVVAFFIAMASWGVAVR